MFGSQSGQPEHELWDLYVLDVFCITALYPLGSQFYLHSPVLPCLPVCCVWVSDSHLGLADSAVWMIKHTHAVISTAPSQNRLGALRGCWTESRLQLACSVTVYTVTPFKICQLHCWACQNPSDCCSVVSTFPRKHISTYLQLHICKIPSEVCLVQKRNFIMTFWCY